MFSLNITNALSHTYAIYTCDGEYLKLAMNGVTLYLELFRLIFNYFLVN